MAGSALTLVGWASGVRRLTDWFDLDISQLPNNAVGVFAGGAATLLLALGYRSASAVLALAAVLIGGATLLEHLAGIELGIDAVLLNHDWGHSATRIPGRMGVPGSTSLLLTGTAIFLSMPERTRSWAAAGGVMIIAIAIVSIVGYAFRATLFYTIPYLTTIALQTAILLLALGIALLMSIPDRLPTRLLIEDSSAALLVLSSLPGIVLVPMLVGWLTLEGERADLFDTAFATAAMVLVLMLLLIALLWRTAQGVQRHERALRESRGRLSAILGSITDAFMTLDSEWRYVFVNDHSEVHWGLPREAMLGSTIWEKFPEAVGTEAHRQLRLAMERRITVEYEYFNAPMNKWYGSRAYPTEGGGLAVYSRDITESKRVEQQRNARLAVTQVLSQAGDANDGARGVLRAVCENLGWDVGFCWTVTGDGQALGCLQSWHRPDVLVAAFAEATCKHTFSSGEGIPGRVWASGQPIWLRDMPSEPGLPRAAASASNGLHSAFASPIVVGDQTLGVIEFFTHRIREADAGLLDLIGTVAGSLGQFIQRRRAEEERRASSNRLSLALSAADLGDWSWDAASDMVTLSNRAADVFGIPPGVPMTWTAMQDLVHPADQERVRREVERVLAERVQYAIQYLLNRQDGTQVWVGVLGRANYDAADQVVGMYGILEDITERKRLEESLRSSEERLRLALDAGRMGVWDWNVRTGDIQWSDSLEPLHGLAPGTFGGTIGDFQQLIHPDDREMANTTLRQALETCGEYYIEFRNQRQNGGIHWIAGSGKVFPGDDGKPLRMLGIGLDVTQRKRAEQTARFLAEASAALAQLVDFDSTLQKISSLAVPYFADWATVDVAQADGSLRRVAVSHVNPDKVKLAHEVHRRFPADPTAPQGVWNILRTSKSEIVPEITDDMLVQSVKDDELLCITRELGLKSYMGVPLTVRGKTMGVITFINAESEHRYDQTDLAVAEDLSSRAAIAIENAHLYRDLRDADRRKDEFLATLAHELRNPLAPLCNAINIRRMGNNPDPLQPVMERQVALLVRLIDDLLDVSRINLDKLTLKRAPTTLQSVVAAALEIASPLIEKGSHPIVRDIPADALPLDADHDRLSQVFSNLVGNAAKYSPTGKPIEISVSMTNSHVRTTIRDHGIGLTPAQCERVFDLFTQVDTSIERSQGGLGIGLSLVRKLVELHDGAVHVHSEGLGQGSCFTVDLPLGETLPPVTERLHSAPLAKGGRALVVDDNRDAADTLALALQVFGLEVRTLYDPMQATDVAADFDPHMVFLDIGMPGLSGYDLARRLREANPDRPRVMIAVTGWGQPEDQRRTAEAGFNHHLVKPPDLDVLRAICASVVP